VSTQTHRLLRRGIPFGAVSTSTPETPVDDGGTRGLHFLAYQTSIEDQFEFVTQTWVNNRNFKEPFGLPADDPITRGGHDPIIGQNNTPGENRQREFTVTFTDASATERHERVQTTTDWVIPTGGGYFFAPSITALEMLSSYRNVALRSAQFLNVDLRMDGSGVTAFSGLGGGTVNCQFGVGAWERFRLEPQTDGTVAIASLAFPGVYLRMDGNGVTAFSGLGGGTVNCQFGVGAWERFRLETA
jgi:hypothetical protein